MHRFNKVRIVGALGLALSGPAMAAPLTIANASAAVVNCAFGCIVNVTTSNKKIPMADVIGTAVLVTRTIRARVLAPGSPATGYAYQVDLRRARASGKFACVSGLQVDFGPVLKRRYGPALTPESDVFVIDSGLAGTIGLASADRDGNIVNLNFSQPVCTETAAGSGKTSFFVGMASQQRPKAATLKVISPAEVPIDVDASIPIQ